MRTLVVTADDVGLHPGMTLGALKAHDEGIVTACSVVATGPALDDAVERLRERPGLDVGVHLTFVGERPLSPPERVRSLLGADGAFLPGFRAFAAHYALGRIDDADLEAELRRQIERLLATGLQLVHANSHQHLHVLPRVFEIVLKLAEEYRIPWVRVPRDPATTLSLRALEIGILNRIGRAARRQTRGRKVRIPDRTVGILDAGRLTPERLVAILKDVESVTELVCHPGIGNRELEDVYRWGYGWDGETAALCDPGVKKAIRDGGIEVRGFSGVP
ncbi:MAG TPA: ChbG/HpnK family deacetylase [Thermoanaerobaculia bacterium]|nr:ChbG/HpnK family deacetylase [Thermoanaerobaculia bacterium]